MISIETHPFAPFVPQGARILILGTFPPPPNRWAFKFYYPNPSNDMWRVMGLIFFGDKNHFYDAEVKKFDLPLIKAFLTQRKIALSDTGAEVKRLKGNASDKYLEIVETIDLQRMLARCDTLEALVTTGEKAAAVIADITHSESPLLGKKTMFEYEGRSLAHYRMPSTSRAYPLAVEKKAELYKQVFVDLHYDFR